MKLFSTIVFLIMIMAMSSETLIAKSYTVGIGDILEVSILKPEQLKNTVTVSPAGEISVAYLGTINVIGKTVGQVQKIIQWRLARGYLKYPVVVVSLLKSHSRKFTISGEVIRPGTYALEVNTTVLKAISIAGGFTRFGSKSKIKILRPRKDRPGYNSIIVDLQKVMDGKGEADIEIVAGDIIIVSEGLF